MENYRFIDGFEDYMVSDKGTVISLKFGRKEMKQHSNGKRYIGVGLTKNGVTKRFLIHRLVAQAFIPNPESKKEVNHIDENKLNNKSDNLEWLSHCENIEFSLGIRKPSCEIIQKDIKNRVIAVWNSVDDLSLCGFSTTAVCHCLKNPDKVYKNFYWSRMIDNDCINNQHFIDMRKAKLFANT